MLNKIKLVVILSLILVFGLPQLILAQKEEEPLRLEEVVITGTKTKRELKDKD